MALVGASFIGQIVHFKLLTGTAPLYSEGCPGLGPRFAMKYRALIEG